MIEQRRSKRIPIKMDLEVSSVFKQDNVQVTNINAPIEIKGHFQKWHWFCVSEHASYWILFQFPPGI